MTKTKSYWCMDEIGISKHESCPYDGTRGRDIGCICDCHNIKEKEVARPVGYEQISRPVRIVTDRIAAFNNLYERGFMNGGVLAVEPEFFQWLLNAEFGDRTIQERYNQEWIMLDESERF